MFGRNIILITGRHGDQLAQYSTATVLLLTKAH